MAKILGETRIKNYGQKVYVLQILHIKQTWIYFQFIRTSSGVHSENILNEL
jgi:hypothetical protein